MPIIAPQHAHVAWRPLQEWPEDCYVQWGSKGLVLSRGSQPRQTAFFEAFLKDAKLGFFRGEGVTVEDAEINAFQKYRRSSDCDHAWSRRTYLNGGAICRRCKAFSTAFEPVVELGSWRKPLSMLDLDLIALGGTAPCSDDSAETNRFRRRLALKAKLAGFKLPTPPDDALEDSREAYEAACMDEVIAFYVRERQRLVMELDQEGGLADLFRNVAATSFHYLAVKRGLIPSE